MGQAPESASPCRPRKEFWTLRAIGKYFVVLSRGVTWGERGVENITLAVVP